VHLIGQPHITQEEQQYLDRTSHTTTPAWPATHHTRSARVPLSTHFHYVRVRCTWLASHTLHVKSKGAFIHTFSSRESAVHLAGQPHITQEEQQYLDRTSHTTTPAWPATHHTRSARVPLSTHFHYVRVRCTWLASHASHKKCKGAFIYTISSRESAVHLIGQPHIIYEEQGCHYPHILIT